MSVLISSALRRFVPNVAHFIRASVGHNVIMYTGISASSSQNLHTASATIGGSKAYNGLYGGL